MPPTVSVLLPYRNAEDTLEEALESVLQETSVDLEVIAVDDGSTDRGPALVERVRRADPRVVPESAPAGGIARALNRALKLARGSCIARMDADDISLPGRLPRQVAALSENSQLGVVGAQVEAFPEGAVGEGMQRYIAWQNAIVTPEDHAREIFVEAPLCHPSVMIRRAALDDVGGVFCEGPWPEDYDLWLRLDAQGYQLAKIPAVLFRWRQRRASATFSDPRYSLARFTEARAHYLAPRLLSKGRPIAVWGAGKTGRRLAREIAARGARPILFIDIDPRKIGRTAQGAPIEAPDSLVPGRYTIVVAVGARGARELIRAHLAGAGFTEGVDFICAA